MLAFLDYASVFVFAHSGALVASRARLDIAGLAFVASITAVGGGTVRDLLSNRNPTFWLAAAGLQIATTAALRALTAPGPIGLPKPDQHHRPQDRAQKSGGNAGDG